MPYLSGDEKTMIEEIVARRDPQAVSKVKKAELASLSSHERERLRSIVLDELAEFGLDEHDEPTAYGHQLEALIDRLGWL